MAWDYYLARDYPQCQATSSKAMQMFPEFWVPHMMAGMCYYVTQQFAQSLDEYKKALAMNPESTFAQAGIGMFQASMGNRAGALKALDDLKAMASKTYVSPGYVALIYHALGDRDTEYTWLEKGYDDEAEWLLFLPSDSIYDGQHNDPCYKALIRRVGLTQ
jgi:tetratricopeptide (TPR) repeat protein